MSLDHDANLHRVLATSVSDGWRMFIDRYTPALLALIERLGIRDQDEAMDLYTLVCQRLSEHDCARLRRRDPGQGSLRAWLAVVVRHVAVDWVRTRAGRRRLFGVIQNLDPLHQQAFQLFYWNDRTPAEIAEELSVTAGRAVKLVEVLSMIDRINETLTERHYSDLVSMTARSKPPVSLEAALEEGTIDPPDRAASPEVRVAGRERQAAFETALAGLAAEDAAIVRLHYVQGLALPDVRRALHLADLSRNRLAAIVDTLRQRLGEAPVPMPAGDRP